jgi:hypothetical protein
LCNLLTDFLHILYACPDTLHHPIIFFIHQQCSISLYHFTFHFSPQKLWLLGLELCQINSVPFFFWHIFSFGTIHNNYYWYFTSLTTNNTITVTPATWHLLLGRMKHIPFFTNIIKYKHLPLYLFKQELQKSLYELMLHNRQQKYFVNSISALRTQRKWVTVYTNQLTTISDGVGDFLLDTRSCEELHIKRHLTIWVSNHCHSESMFDEYEYNIKYSGFQLTGSLVNPSTT